MPRGRSSAGKQQGAGQSSTYTSQNYVERITGSRRVTILRLKIADANRLRPGIRPALRTKVVSVRTRRFLVGGSYAARAFAQQAQLCCLKYRLMPAGSLDSGARPVYIGRPRLLEISDPAYPSQRVCRAVLPVLNSAADRSRIRLEVRRPLFFDEIGSIASPVDSVCRQERSAVALPNDARTMRQTKQSQVDHTLHYYGEFDPGSGRTLAAGLTHASRTRKGPSGPE